MTEQVMRDQASVGPIDFQERAGQMRGPQLLELATTPELEIVPRIPSFTVNTSTRQIIIGDMPVRFRHEMDWQIFIQIASAIGEVSAYELARLKEEYDTERKLTTATPSYFIKRVRKTIGDDPKNPQVLISTGEKSHTKYRLNAEIKFVGEQEKYDEVPEDRLKALEFMLLNWNAGDEEIQRSLDPEGVSEISLSKDQLWGALTGANNALQRREEEGALMTEPGKGSIGQNQGIFEF